MSRQFIQTELDTAGILTVTLNRPAVFNALNVPMLEELLATFQEEAAAPEVRCMVLTGRDAAFVPVKIWKNAGRLSKEPPNRPRSASPCGCAITR